MLDRICLIFVAGWFLFGGAGHFISADFFVGIVPPYIPRPEWVVAVSGVFELLGAAGLLYRPTRRAAAVGLFLLTLAVTPANVYMWQNPQLFPLFPPVLLGVRLLVQVVLLAAIARLAWSSRQMRALA